MSDIIPNLENMTDAEKKAALDAIQVSIAKSKEVQKQRIGENVGLVIDALKKIESDIQSRYDLVGNTLEKRVATIKDGKDGKDGRDGRNGRDGLNGKQGVQGIKGEDGRDGRDGVDGVDGISVTSARIDFDGSLIIGLSSGIELNVGEVVAPDLAESIKVITNGGGTSQSVLDTLASLQTQIDNLIPSQTGNSGKFLTTNGTSTSWATVSGGGGLSYQGTWNATTNTPTLASSTGTNGYYYIVATAGSTNLNGITDWKVGDWLLFNGSTWQKIDQSETLQSITSTDGSVTVTTTGSTADLSVAVAASTTNVVCYVRNSTGATLTKGTAVYINGATGQNPTVTKAQANNDANSAQTLGLMSADLANNSNGYVTIIGLITDIDTSAFTDGEQLYLSPTTAGALTATKSYAPNHLVYVAIVEHAHPTQGKLFVKVQNGYELDELHNVSAQSPSNGQTIVYNATTSLWEKANLTAGTGIGVSNGAGSITVSNSGVTSAVAGTGISVSGATGAVTISNTGVTSVTGTSPVASSGGATPAISLATAYGDTLNPYASKTANFVLAAPNGSAGVPTFRAVVAADIPTLNQNTTGTASNVTGTVAIANGGTGQTTATAAFNALAPSQTSNSGKYLTTDGTNSSWASVSASAATPTALGTVYGSTSSGSSVTLLGYQAGNASISGGNNTVVGFTAGTALTSGNGNTLTGYRAGITMTSGSANSFYGIDAGKLLTTGAYNVGVGIEALRSATTSDANIGVGAYALQVATTGASNLGIGYNTLGALTTASGNVALGREAGSALTTGSYNIYIGYQTGNGTKTGGVDCIYMGRGCTPNNAGVNGEMIINTNGGAVTGKGDGTGFITTGGNLYNGLNTTAWQTTSDRRLKKNIVNNTEGLDKITQIQVRNFEYRLPEEITELDSKNAIEIKGVQLGVIAQELQTVLPECVKEESSGVLSVQSDNLTWYLINAVKELKAELDALKAKVA